MLFLARDGNVVVEPVVVGAIFSDVSSGDSLAGFLSDSADGGPNAKAMPSGSLVLPSRELVVAETVVDPALPSGSLVLPSREVVVESSGEAGEGRDWLCVGGAFGRMYCLGLYFFFRVL